MNILGFEKILYHPEKLIAIKNNNLQFPIHATVSLNNYCNHACLWCAAYERQLDKSKIIQTKALIKFLQRGKSEGLKAVTYVGNGEPTTHPQFDEIIENVAQLGLQQGMFTNGYLLDRYLNPLIDNFLWLRVSLDAGSEEVHNKMHAVKGHFSKIIDNIEKIVAMRDKEKFTIGIQYAVHDQNIDDLWKGAQLAKELKVDYFSIKPIFKRGAVGKKVAPSLLSEDNFVDTASQIKNELESDIFKVYFRPFQIRSIIADKNIFSYDTCVAGFFNIDISEEGDIMSCDPLQVKIGNIQDNIEKIKQQLMNMSTTMNLEHCPAGCRYHPLNYLVHKVLHPECANNEHIHFI